MIENKEPAVRRTSRVAMRLWELVAGMVGLALFLLLGCVAVSTIREDTWLRLISVSFFFLVGIPGALVAWRCFLGPARRPEGDGEGSD